MANPLQSVRNIIGDRYTKDRASALIETAMGGDTDFLSRGQYDHLANLDSQKSSREPVCKENLLADHANSPAKMLTHYLMEAVTAKLVDGINSLDLLEQHPDHPRIKDVEIQADQTIAMAARVMELNDYNFRVIFDLDEGSPLTDFLDSLRSEIIAPLQKYIEEKGIEPDMDEARTGIDFFAEPINEEKWTELSSVNVYKAPEHEG